MPLFILTYEAVEGYVEKRVPLRPEHFALATAAAERGDLLAGGAVGEPIEQALLIFKGDGPEIAEEFARNDPYVINGLVTDWTVKPWAVAIGAAGLQDL